MINKQIIFSLCLLLHIGSTKPFQKLKNTISHPYSLLSGGIMGLGIYSYFNKTETLNAYELVKNCWHTIPSLIKYPILCAFGWGIYYAYYNNGQHYKSLLDHIASSQPNKLTESPRASFSQMSETQNLLKQLTRRVTNIELIIGIDKSDIEKPQKATRPSQIAMLIEKTNALEDYLIKYEKINNDQAERIEDLEDKDSTRNELTNTIWKKFEELEKQIDNVRKLVTNYKRLLELKNNQTK